MLCNICRWRTVATGCKIIWSGLSCIRNTCNKCKHRQLCCCHFEYLLSCRCWWWSHFTWTWSESGSFCNKGSLHTHTHTHTHTDCIHSAVHKADVIIKARGSWQPLRGAVAHAFPHFTSWKRQLSCTIICMPELGVCLVREAIKANFNRFN